MNRREDDHNRHDRDNRGGNQNRNIDQEARNRGDYRFDDHRTTRDQYGDRHDNGRDDRGRADQRNTQGASNNYGNMGSYGGAQGFGSSRGGYGHRDDNRTGFDATSGHGRNTVPGNRREVYGAYWDKNSFSERDHDRFSEEHREHRPDPNRDLRRNENNREDDSRYEIYDTSQGQFNAAPERSSISDDFNQHLDDDRQRGQREYGSNQRPRNRQGSGSDQDRNFGRNMNNEGNMAGSLSDGYDGYRGYGDEDRNNRYNPMNGRVNRDPDRRYNDQDRQDRNRPRGGYDTNNRNRDERDRNR